MPNPSEIRLDDIHAMMMKAHNSVRIEPHSFMLIGPAVAAVMMLSIWVIKENLIPDLWTRVLVLNAINAVILAAVLYVDRKLTQRSRDKRGETVSLVQKRLTRFLWVLIVFVFALDFLVAKFGWWRASYFTAISVLGLYLVVTGLFSRQPLLIAGLFTLAVAFFSSMFGPPWAIRAMAISVFGIGMPLFGLLVARAEQGFSIPRYAIAAGVWLVAVIMPVGAVLGWQRNVEIPQGDVISLADYQEAGKRDDAVVRIIKIPAGTKVPLYVAVKGNVLVGETKQKITVTTSKTVLISVKGDRPDGRIKVGERDWQGPNNHRVRFFVSRLQNRLHPKFGFNSALQLNAKY